jgi:hypothetical protein
LLIVEATLGLALTASKLNEAHVWFGFFVAVGLFLSVFLAVTGLVIWKPENLLFGAEEHSKPVLDKSALRDQIEDSIEDFIYANVKPECLQKSEKRGN